jgi:hypothetical protein
VEGFVGESEATIVPEKHLMAIGLSWAKWTAKGGLAFVPYLGIGVVPNEGEGHTRAPEAFDDSPGVEEPVPLRFVGHTTFPNLHP